MAIVLALGSALAYGVSDYVGGLVSRRTSAWAVGVVGQLGAVTVSVALALAVGGSPAGADVWWSVLAGVGTAVGVGFLYRGFATGRMSVVAPVSAVGAAVLPVLVGAATGERPSWLVWAGVVIALPAIWLVARASPEDDADARPDSLGGHTAAAFVDGVLAGLGFGVLFAALGQVSDAAGLWPVATGQATSIAGLVVLASALRADWVPRDRAVWWALTAGLLGALANAAFLLSARLGYLSVAGVLASFYPATTILLAAVLLKERIHRAQGVGLLLCGLAVGLVAAG